MLPEDRGYYEAMHPERYPPEPWYVDLLRGLVGMIAIWALFGALVAILATEHRLQCGAVQSEPAIASEPAFTKCEPHLTSGTE
jgi:hypothetical protein